MKWIAGYIAENEVDAEWVSGPVLIKKAMLNIATKFWWVVVRSLLCPTMADNHLSLDCTVLVASIMAGYDIDFV